MAVLCKKCGVVFVGDGDVNCSHCSGAYHFRCSGVQETTFKKMTADKRASWKCLQCRQSDGGIGDSFSELIKEIKGLKLQINSMHDGLDQALQGIVNIESKLTAMETRMDGFESRLTLTESKVERLQSLEADYKNLESQFAALKSNEDGRDQFCRMNNVEISGVPQKNGENLLTILRNIAVKVGFELRETDVDVIHRVRRFTTTAGDAGRAADPRPPAIVVRFCQRRRKDELVAAARARRNLTSADAGLPGAASPIYVNEHLTAAKKLLLKRARDIKNELSYSYLWVKQCKIYMRKKDGSRIHVISNADDLSKLKYEVYRHDRCGRAAQRGGGVLLAARRGLRVTRRDDWCAAPRHEELWLTAQTISMSMFAMIELLLCLLIF
ncbi:uncharacterized protein [Choristoneura fumiferana]|uniref:uncharacterized protein n=1 Tax=Choristoneura fumiferana TaxID=7141 RepID=UPI003D15C73A